MGQWKVIVSLGLAGGILIQSIPGNTSDVYSSDGVPQAVTPHPVNGDLTQDEAEEIFRARLHWSKRHLASALAAHLEELSAEHRVKKLMVLAVIHAESGFRFSASSFKGAVGLMQLLPSTAGYMAEKHQIAGYRHPRDLHDPFVNLSLGVAYLGYLQKRFTNSIHIVAAYNKGPTAVKREVSSRTFSLGALEPYVKKVHQEARRLQSGSLLTAQNR